jgi:UPF0755 protein
VTLTDDRRAGRRGGAEWDSDPWDAGDGAVAVERLRRQNRTVKWVVWLALVVATTMILVAGSIGWWYIWRINPPGDPEPPQTFTIEDQDTLRSISERLEEQGIIVDASVFRWYVERHGGLEITPGYYEIPPGDHVGNVLARLRTPPGRTFTNVTFPEGFTVAQMGQRLDEALTRMTAEGFATAAADPAIVSAYRPAGVTSLEGLLFPDTYQVSNGESEAQVIERMIALMERVGSQEDLERNANELLRTPYEVLIVASMIEREAKVDEDRPKIAQVIWNRIAAGMPLQIDATLLYGQDPSRSIAELREVDSPYNTYMYSGLPPTPIANPGRASIRAAATARPGDLPPGDPLCADLPDRTVGCRLTYYVLADADGRHAFAVTVEQHEANIQRARDAGLL